MTGGRIFVFLVTVLLGSAIMYLMWLYEAAAHNSVSPEEYADMARELVERSRL